MSSHKVPSALESVYSAKVYNESVADFWESVHDDWPQKPYSIRLVNGLIELFDSLKSDLHIQIHDIIDLGAGAGNPCIGLASKGYNVVAVDKDGAMVERFSSNAKAEGASITTVYRDWTTLLSDFQGHTIKANSFDFALCRGNSLIYAASWEVSDLIQNVALAAVQTSLFNCYHALRPGGILYVDITHRKEYESEKEHFEAIGTREINGEIVNIYWFVRYDIPKKKRIVRGFRVFHDRASLQIQRIASHVFVSYHLAHKDLVTLCRSVGFELYREYVTIPGEDHYDVFLFRRPMT